MAKTKEYSNGEVTVVWQADKCIHSGICAKGLPNVFRPSLRPWVKIDAETTDTIISQVKQCPSGALSYHMNKKEEETIKGKKTVVEVLENGPLLVYGALTVTNKDGLSEEKNKTTAFCRCGFSSNKPYCDGAHVRKGFKG